MKLKITLFILLSYYSINGLSQFIDNASFNIELGVQAPNSNILNSRLESLDIPKIPGVFDSFGMGITLKKQRVFMDIRQYSNFSTSDQAIESFGSDAIIGLGYQIKSKDERTLIYPMIGIALSSLKLIIEDSVQIINTDFNNIVDGRYYNKIETANIGLLTQIQLLYKTRLDNIYSGPYIGYIWSISKSYWKFQGEPLSNGPKTNAGGFIFGFRLCFNLEKSD